MKGSHRCLSLGLFCLLLFCYAYVYQGGGYNQNSRLDLLHALYVHRTFSIDEYHTNTGDKALFNGKYYSTKGPGIAFIAFPSFVLSAKLLEAIDIPLDGSRGWIISSWITTVSSVGVLTAFGGVLMVLLLGEWIGRRYALIVTLGVFLGAAPFPYATMLFSHAGALGLLCIALWALLASHTTAQGRELKLHGDILAGLACGLAIASEYSAAPAAGGMLLIAFSHGWVRGVRLAAAALIPLFLIPLYSVISFDSPFVVGYSYSLYAKIDEGVRGFFSFPPSLRGVWTLLGSPSKGLFFWSPVFLLAFPGYVALRRRSRSLFWITIIIPLTQVIAIASYQSPHGGWALGPRFITSIIPFLMLPTALGFRRFPEVGVGLVLLSITFTGFGTLITAQTPNHLSHPLVQLYFPKLLEGKFITNLGSVLGLSGWWSVLPLFVALVTGVTVLLRFSPRSES